MLWVMAKNALMLGGWVTGDEVHGGGVVVGRFWKERVRFWCLWFIFALLEDSKS